MRTILHCDANNFYASVECYLNPALKGKYVAVSGNPEKRAAAIVKAVADFNNADLIAKLSENLGEAMVGINEQEIALLMAERGK